MVTLISSIVLLITIICILVICYRKTERTKYIEEELSLFEQALLGILVTIGACSLAILVISIRKYI